MARKHTMNQTEKYTTHQLLKVTIPFSTVCKQKDEAGQHPKYTQISH